VATFLVIIMQRSLVPVDGGGFNLIEPIEPLAPCLLHSPVRFSRVGWSETQGLPRRSRMQSVADCIKSTALSIKKVGYRGAPYSLL